LDLKQSNIWTWNHLIFGPETILYLDMEPSDILTWNHRVFGTGII